MDEGPAVGTKQDLIDHTGSVLTVLASYWGDHYREHLEVIKAIVSDRT